MVWYFFGWYIAIWFLFGYWLHWFGFDPDLDLVGLSRSESMWIKSVIFMPLLLMSTFYARALEKFGSHRSIWSHGFFIGTFIRLFYFGAPFILLFRHYYLDSLVREFFGMYLGLCVADNWHIGADFITGEMNFFGRIGGKNQYLKGLMKKYFDYPKDRVRSKRRPVHDKVLGMDIASGE